MEKEDNFCIEVLNLDCKDFCDYVDRTLVDMAKNPQADLFEAWKLYKLKRIYMEKFVYSMHKFKKLNFEQQLILYLYYIKNRSCDDVARILRVSVRTFFRKLKHIKELWFKNESKI